MKVLFAVSNDNITTSVVAKYQQKYKEIITSKNVYYFNAIIKELQNDKTYDAVVIGEDLEPIANNNFETIDKFLISKLDNISDEAAKPNGDNIPIIFICSDRRTKQDNLMTKLFSMSIYNALVGNDRSLDMVCALINKPRNKKEAKKYYQLDVDSMDYDPSQEELVSEDQLKNIISYYKKIGNNEKKCVQAFDSIAKQYDNTQLRLIVKVLPMDVKAILEMNSLTYQNLMQNGTVLSDGTYTPYKPNRTQDMDIISTNLPNVKPMNEQVVIPSNMGIRKVDFNNSHPTVVNTNKGIINQPNVAKPMNNGYVPQQTHQSFNTQAFNPYQTNGNNPYSNPYQQSQQGFNPYQQYHPMQPVQNSKTVENTQSFTPVAPIEPIQPIQPLEPVKPVQKDVVVPQKIETPKPESYDINEDLGLGNKVENLLNKNIFEDNISNDLENNNIVEEQKNENVAEETEKVTPVPVEPVKRGRGRPRKEVKVEEPVVKKRRGRPRKNAVEEEKNEVEDVKSNQVDTDEAPILPLEPINSIEQQPIEKTVEPSAEPKFEENFGLSSIEPIKVEESVKEEKVSELNDIANANVPSNTNEPSIDLFNLGIDDNTVYPEYKETPYTPSNYENLNSVYSETKQIVNQKKNDIYLQDNFSVVGNGKLVAFVGSSKNGTSFIVNNLAQLLSNDGIKTCIIDLTTNRNSYYLYTDNDLKKTEIATKSLDNLSNNNVAGLNINSNLTLFTSLPEEKNEENLNVQAILNTASSNFDVVLLDCDLHTNPVYFKKANEVYLIQSMDAFTIQPLTKFLSDLKEQNLLDESKLRVVVNKYIKLKKIDYKMIVAGMSKYNQPAMTLQRDLFDPKKIQVSIIPFDIQTYQKYLETIALCRISLNGYSNEVIQSLKQLENQVYPLVGQGNVQKMSRKQYGNYAINNKENVQNINQDMNYISDPNKQTFSNNVSSTLDKMRKNNY